MGHTVADYGHNPNNSAKVVKVNGNTKESDTLNFAGNEDPTHPKKTT